MLETDKIYNINCLDGLRKLPDKCIELTVTSPPYDSLRLYNGYSFDFESIAKELFRVTKDGGIIVWVVGDATKNGNESGTSFRQALFFQSIGFNLHDTMIYAKKNPLPQNQKRYESAFEYMFILTKGKIQTFNPIKEECKMAGKTNTGTTRKADGRLQPKTGSGRPVKCDKVKSNIWAYAVGKNHGAKNHPASFPERLALDHVTSWSNEGNIVLDVFMGSGTTAVAAIKTNRRFIGFELSVEYCAIAEERIAQIHTEKTEGQATEQTRLALNES